MIRKEIQLDEFMIMPNHFHAIVWIKQSVETTGRSSLQEHPKILIFQPISRLKHPPHDKHTGR